MKTNAGFTFNSVTGMLGATGFTGPLTGNASTATALAADPANCTAGQIALGVTAGGGITMRSNVAAEDFTQATMILDGGVHDLKPPVAPTSFGIQRQ